MGVGRRESRGGEEGRRGGERGGEEEGGGQEGEEEGVGKRGGVKRREPGRGEDYVEDGSGGGSQEEFVVAYANAPNWGLHMQIYACKSWDLHMYLHISEVAAWLSCMVLACLIEKPCFCMVFQGCVRWGGMVPVAHSITVYPIPPYPYASPTRSLRTIPPYPRSFQNQTPILRAPSRPLNAQPRQYYTNLPSLATRRDQ